MEIIVKRGPETQNSSAGFTYQGEKIFKLNDKSYKVIIRGKENPSKEKASFYIYTIKDIQKNKFVSIQNKKTWETIWRVSLKCLYFLDFKMKKWKEEREIISRTQKISSKKYIPPEQIVANDKDTIISFELNNEEIKKILENKKNKKEIYFSTNLIILREFVNLWKEKIKKDAKENEFRKIFFEQKILINLILGYNIENEVKKENYLEEEKTNKTDLEGKNWIVEFKKPTTPLFTKKSSRNNIYGISNELASSKNQLDLYVKKKNRESNLINSFNYGTLIIGNINQFKNENKLENNQDKILAWKIFNESSTIRILLFSDVLEIAKNLIKMFESKEN